MKKIIHILTGIILLVVGLQFFLGTPKQVLASELEGEWLNERYINNLKLTKSPIKSLSGVSEVHFEIKKKPQGYEWFTVYNFHEGSPFKLITALQELPEKSSYQLVLKKDDPGNYYINDDTFYKFTTDPKTKLSKITYANEGKQVVFVKLDKTVNHFVNNLVLAGKYQDSKGFIYQFNADGTAKWPGKQFKYEINLDPFFNKYDYFRLVDDKEQGKHKLYCFEQKGKQLYLYRAKENDGEPFLKREAKPFLILKPLNKGKQ